MKKVTKTVVGVILIILGLLALFTPLTPGSWLILIGLEFLGLRILLEKRLWKWTEARPDSRISRGVRKVLRLKPRDRSGRPECDQTKKDAS